MAATTPRERIVLLFCHGGSLNKEIWKPIQRRLEATSLLQRVTCEYVTFDWRYHGTKSSDDDAATIYYEDDDTRAPRVEHPCKHWPEWAPQDLLQFVQALRQDDAAIQIVGIGHSMGAATLLHVEANYPGTFAGLVLFEPAFGIGQRSKRLGTASTIMVLNTLAREEEWSTWTDVVKNFKAIKHFQLWHPESLMAFLSGAIKKTSDGKRFRLAMPLIQEASLYCHELMVFTQEQIARVACPVVLEFGDSTRLFNLPLAQNVAKALPKIFTLGKPLEEKTHLMVAEDPETCAAHIVLNLERFPVFQRALAATTSKL